MNESEKSAEQPVDAVPYIAYESALARQDRHIKHLFIALIVAIIVAFASNAIWLYCWMQYDYVSDTYTVDSQDGGNANFIGNDGDIINGKDYSQEILPDAENQQLP